MYVTLVRVQVKPEYIADFINASRHNHEQSIQENGNLRFDILQSPDHPHQFLLYEAYQSEAQAKAHKNTEHYLAWRESVAGWMAKPRQGTVYQGLFPR